MSDGEVPREMLEGIPILFFAGAEAWETWLSANSGTASGIWIKMAKQGSKIPSIIYLEALDVALCYGWIDGKSKSMDDTYYLRKFTPRRKRSLWSKINIGKAMALVAAGRMREPGFAQIEAAKADGRWARAYDSAKAATLPPDLAAFLQSRPAAKKFFEGLSAANRYAFLWRLMTAKTQAAREARFAKIAAMLEAGETFH